GHHAGHNFEFQDFLVVPHGFATYPEALEAIVAVHRAARVELESRGYVLTGTADEGGWGPKLPTNELALEILGAAINKWDRRPGLSRTGREACPTMSIAIDVAATHFWRDGAYHLEGHTLSSSEMIDLLSGWVERYPIVSIEDGLAEDDWEGWRQLTRALGSRVQLVGDDLFVTNTQRIDRGIKEKVGNAILIKLNQIGTLTETLAAIEMGRKASYKSVSSDRSGETEDDFIADLAVATEVGQIKTGSLCRSERVAKYNRLLRIESELGSAAKYGVR